MPAKTTDPWMAQLREQAAIALQGSSPHLPTLKLLGRNTAVADAQSVYWVNEDHVLLVSPARFPDASAEEAAKMHAMKERLGPHAGRVILDVRGQGRVGGRSFFIVPRCRPLPQGRVRGRIARWMIQGEMLQWLRDVTTLADAPDAASQAEFLTSLTALQQMHELPGDIRSAAERLAQALGSGTVHARHVPMHGDIWADNIMRQHDGSLALIDWPGSAIRGYGVYGLIRLAGSFGLSRRRLAREIRWHGQTLGHAELAAELHLLGALGHYARHLGEFPVARFVGTAQHSYQLLKSAQG